MIMLNFSLIMRFSTLPQHIKTFMACHLAVYLLWVVLTLAGVGLCASFKLPLLCTLIDQCVTVTAASV